MTQDAFPFDCRDKEDISILAEATRGTSNPIGIAAVMMASGMMKAQWWLHALARFIAWRHDLSPQQAWTMMFIKLPAMAEEIIAGAADWIENGKDKDGEGVGGFNQREVETLSFALARAMESEARSAAA